MTHPLIIMQIWVKIKLRMNKDRRKLIRQKAVAGAELVGAGAAGAAS